MKRRLLALVIVLVMLCGVISCGKSDVDTSSGDEDNGAKDNGVKEFYIGGIGPLTGEVASYGVSVKNAAELAVDEVNANGGVNGMTLKLNFQDDAHDGEKAVNAYNTLMDAGMKVLLGTVTSNPCIAVSEKSKEDGILQVTPSGSAVDCIKYDNAFRICFNDPEQGTASADFISKNLTAKKIGVIYDSSDVYSSGIYETFKAASATKGLTIVTEQAFTDQSNTDFSVQLQKIKESGAELVFIPIYYEEAALIMTQAQTAEMKIPFFGCDGLDGVIKQLGDNTAAAEGTMLLTPFAADADDKATKDFVAAYKAKYNSIPDQFAADAYDGIYTIVAAIKEAGIEDSADKDLDAKLIAAMTKITVDGLTGKMTWDVKGEPTKTAKAVKIVGGSYQAL